MGEFFEMQEEGILCLRCGAATVESAHEAEKLTEGFRLCKHCIKEGYTVEMVLKGEEPDEDA